MHTLFEAFGLGLVGGVVPGSILTILLVSVMQGGFPAGRRAFLWSFAAELTIVSILLSVLFSLPIPGIAFGYIGFVGALALFYFGTQVSRIRAIEEPGRQESRAAAFTGWKIYALAATNAPLYIFWTTVCAPLIWDMTKRLPVFVSAASFMAAFEIGWGLSTFAVMLLFVGARRYLENPRIMRKVYVGVAAFMFLLGIRMLFLSASSLGILW